MNSTPENSNKAAAGDDKSQSTNATGGSEPRVDIDRQIAKRLEMFRWNLEHGDEYEVKLLQNIKTRLPELEKLLAEVEGWNMEDGLYQLYYHSFKIYHRLQPLTEKICKALQEVLPDRPLNKDFAVIFAEGTGRQWDVSHNANWLHHTRPIVEAFLHAHYFLKMACKYGRKLDRLPEYRPSGWEAVLYFYSLCPSITRKKDKNGSFV